MAWAHWRRSGWLFLWFLFVNFTLYRLVAALRDACRSPHTGAAALGSQPLLQARRCPFATTTDLNDRATVARLRAAAPDLIVVYYFDKALGDEAIAAARSVINVHTALLPRHRGILPEAWPLSFGETEIGVTAHLITDRGIDSGAILDFRRVSVEPGWSVPETSQRANRARVEMLM